MIFDNTITREDFNKSLILKGLEAFTDVQVEQWTKEAKEILEKSTKEELNDIEKSQLEEFTVYAPNLCKVTVVNNDLTKSLMYYRTAQVEWEKSEDGEIMKARSGTYANTSENKKLGRVGQKYGESKKQEEPKKEEGEKLQGEIEKLSGEMKSAPIGSTLTWENKEDGNKKVITYEKVNETQWKLSSEHENKGKLLLGNNIAVFSAQDSPQISAPKKEEDKGSLKSRWAKMSLKNRDKFLDSFKEDRPEDYKIVTKDNPSFNQSGVQNFEALPEASQDILSSYYKFEYVDPADSEIDKLKQAKFKRQQQFVHI